ncbi:MAG TPA: glycosyltransferase family 4 protein [Candidatus Limnocylindria bacterium]|nr:glycosyltransferase family 4 protein [Candidatus Limnocylindria bacterium]
MRVLLHANVDLSRPGGLETHVRELATHLTARGHGIEILGRPRVLSPFTMVERAEVSRYDVIHHHGGPWPRGLDMRGRYVKTLHFCVAAKMEIYVRMGRLRTLANVGNWRAVAEERRACHRPGRLIAVADRVRHDFARWHGLDPAAVPVIPNGASFGPPRESRDALRARHGIGASARVLLTIGRDDFVKGQALLARAWERSGAVARGAVWVNVGGSAPARSLGHVVTGPVSHQEVVDWIHAAELGALPSYYEGCSVALLEMLAGGLFTLAHDVGNASEVIRSDAIGRIVPSSEVAWTTELRAALDRPSGARLPAIGPEFGWPAIAARVEQVYEQIPGREPA